VYNKKKKGEKKRRGSFFFLENVEELHFIILRRKRRRDPNYNTHGTPHHPKIEEVILKNKKFCEKKKKEQSERVLSPSCCFPKRATSLFRHFLISYSLRPIIEVIVGYVQVKLSQL
jgi:hypothetical protein